MHHRTDISQHRVAGKVAVSALLMALAPWTYGQTAAPAASETKPVTDKTPSAEKSVPEDVIELSPFEVSGDNSNGYAATSSLAASRLKTDLKDVASPISVVTTQFIRDTGATNAESLMIYTTSTEVGGIQGNYGGDPSLAKLNPSKNNRVRGLDGADQTRDYFATDIPLDTYNVTQVDIQRGPNSILFGLGSPAGIFNYSTKKPGLQKNKYSTEFRFGSYNAGRESFDVDQTLVKGTLGVRIDGVNTNNKYEQKYTFENQKRIYGAIRWTPKVAEGVYTELTANMERGKGSYNRPETRPPEDWISTWYSNLGKFTNSTGTWKGYTYQTIPQYAPYLAAYQAGPGGNWWDGLGAVFSDPTSNKTGGNGIPDAIRQRGGTDGIGSGSGSWITPSNPFAVGDGTYAGNHFFSKKSYCANNPTMLDIIGKYEAATGKTFSDGRDIGWQNAQITDRSIFDYRKQSLAGPSNSSWDDIKSKNFSFVQTYLNNRAGIEVVYDNQVYKNGDTSFLGGGSGNRLAIDINEKLRDNATVNPNFGRAVVVGDYGANVTLNEREALRATGFYNLKFKDLVGHRSLLTDILGEHTFTGMASKQTHSYLNYSYGLYELGDEYVNGFRPDRGIQGVHYLNSAVNLASVSGLQGAHITGVGAVQGPGASISVGAFNTTGAWQTANSSVWSYNDSVGVSRLIGTSPNATKDTTNSKALIWQSRFLKDTVIGLVGLRYDNYEKLTKGANNYVQGNAYSYGQPFSPEWSYDNKDVSKLRASKTQASYGLVLHAPEFITKHLPLGTELSLTFNKANNFAPGALGFDPYRNQNPSPAGETKDWGVLVNTLDGKLEVRATFFTTSQKNTPVGNLGAWSIKNRLSRAMNGLFVEGWNQGTSGRAQTTPEKIVNKWFFGEGNYDAGVANTPLPAGWTVASHPELLKQPLRIRAAAQVIHEGDRDANGNLYSEPPLTAEEIAYRTSWFLAQPDSAWYRPFGKELFDALQFRRDVNYWGGIWTDNVPTDMKGIGDIVTKGSEYEITYNPTKNWRITANVSKAEAKTSNVWGAIKDYIDKFQGVALDGWDKTVPAGTSINYWHRDGYADVDAWGFNGGQMLGWDWYNDVQKSYLTTKASEGRAVSELRKWHANVITAYDFDHGRLKGVSIGGAVRWMSAANIGYYPKYDTNLGTWIQDLDKPINAPSEVNYDLWVGYSRKITKRVNWSVQLNVHNLFAKDDLIPVAANGDGSYGTYRIGATTTFDLTNRFEF